MMDERLSDFVDQTSITPRVYRGDPKQLDSLREGQRMVPETFEPPRTYPEFAAVAVKH